MASLHHLKGFLTMKIFPERPLMLFSYVCQEFLKHKANFCHDFQHCLKIAPYPKNFHLINYYSCSERLYIASSQQNTYISVELSLKYRYPAQWIFKSRKQDAAQNSFFPDSINCEAMKVRANAYPQNCLPDKDIVLKTTQAS